MQSEKKKRFTLRRTIYTLLAIIVATAGLCVYLIQRPPAIYRNAQQVLEQTTETSRETLKQNVLDQLTNLTNDAENIEIDQYASLRKPAATRTGTRIDAFGNFQKHREPVQQEVVPIIVSEKDRVDRFVEMSLTNEELVAFVYELFVDWTIQRGYIVPGGLSDPVVMARKGELVLAFNIDTPHWQQVFSGKLKLSFKEDGMAIGEVSELHAGSLPISLLSFKDMLKMQMPADMDDDAERIGNWLEKLERFEFRPVIELDKRRRARIYGMDVADAGVDIKLRVQDHQTYRQHNDLLGRRQMAVTDQLGPEIVGDKSLADVPTTTD